MIIVKTAKEIERMREAGRLSAQALNVAKDYMREGVTTREIDQAIRKFIISKGARPSFLGLYGFPASACISVNDTIIHGIPSDKIVLKNGDIVSVDVGAYYDGFHGDNAYTFTVGEVSDEAKKLLEVTKKCLELGIAKAVAGNRIGDISHAIQEYAESFGYGVVRQFVGHGVGKNLHEDPEVPNFGSAGRGPRLVKGMVLAIEPMINIVGAGIKQMDDGWTYKTQSGSLSAHFENTVVITDNEARILTAL